MNIHEYQSKKILKDFGVNVMQGIVVNNKDDIDNALDELGGDTFAIKSQIHAGGRAIGGGVKIAKSKIEANKFASEMLGSYLITPQTPKDGILVNKVYIEKALKFKKEFYLCFTFDRINENISLIVSKDGGVSIEETAKTNPELIKRLGIDFQIGLCGFHIQEFLQFLGFDKDLGVKFGKLLKSLYEIYIQKEAILVEINPLVISDDDELYALDAKLSFDDSALFRHKDIAELDDLTQTNENENQAKALNLSYIKLDGNVGCVVNGAGLAMATMDIIKDLGGSAANFLDVGGSANEDGVSKAFELILRDKNVKVIFVNIFGGIVRCDIIAHGICEACKHLALNVPVVIRLDGTNSKEAIEILKQSGLSGIYASSNLYDGAKMAVEIAKKGDI
ncbi:ADP-forming succinate--CoA ligase subunit beta [Campylobacter pinnipediorum]|uniref:ADP-forming succinate--CoA ligase subunit beta n=1 Tax=Campylobacter pinnipediorum TaxID=1965231 RepID=UPI00084D40F0|nr:ADP-forming succinate--CoA ligase subunit beta [Campylobacter pinnipediorum]